MPSAADVDLVHTRWTALCARIEVVPQRQCQQWWDRLVEAYEGPGRHYHTLKHIEELLLVAQRHLAEISDQSAVELAIFFHDIVYDAKHGGGGKNERDSAAVFGEFVQDAHPQNFSGSDKVHRWIVATKDHMCAADDEWDMKLFMDFDMAILAAPEVAYNEYAHNVRQEYGHLSTLAWCYGRSRFLSAFAENTEARIFATSSFYAQSEAVARANARREAASLRHRGMLILGGGVAALVVLVVAVLLARANWWGSSRRGIGHAKQG